MKRSRFTGDGIATALLQAEAVSEQLKSATKGRIKTVQFDQRVLGGRSIHSSGRRGYQLRFIEKTRLVAYEVARSGLNWGKTRSMQGNLSRESAKNSEHYPLAV